MTLENAVGGLSPVGYFPDWSPVTDGYWPPALDPWSPRSTDDCRPPVDTGDYTTPPNTDYMYRVQPECRQESIEEKLDRIIVLLEQLVKNL